MGDDIDDAVRLHRLGERHEALESSGFESNPNCPTGTPATIPT
jgi:hypothetical protein